MDGILQVGSGSVLGAIAFGVALFLRTKFEAKKDKGSSTMYGEGSGSSGVVRSLLESIREDRREMKEVFREVVAELRETNTGLAALGGRMDGFGKDLGRIEQKQDAFLLGGRTR